MTDDSEYFIPLPEWIVLAGLSPQAVALYAVLLGHVNRKRGDNLAFPSLDTLATILGFGKRQSLSRYLDELVALGAIEVDTRKCATGRRNFYTVHREPPEGYLGLRSIVRFHEVERETRGGSSPTGDNGSSALGDGGWSPTGGKNQTNGTRRSDSYESSTSGDQVAWSAPRTSSQGPMKIHVPADFDRRPVDELPQLLIKLTVGATEDAGYELDAEAKSRFGNALKHNLEQGVEPRRLVSMMENSLNDGRDGKGDWAWMFGYERAA